MSPLVEAKALTVRRGARAILDGLSLTVPSGEVVALVGPNGSGKSTALRILAGALAPDSGEVIYDGRPSGDVSALDRARFLAYLPQDFASHWDLAVADLLRLGASRGDGFGWLDAIHRTSFVPGDLARAFELEPLLERRLSTLSGGERARAALAATVAGNPRLVLADEPAASLDVAHQLRTMRRFTAMKKTTGALVAAHDLNLAGRFADRIVVLHRGRAVLSGPASEVLHSALLDDVFETAFERRSADWGVLLVPK